MCCLQVTVTSVLFTVSRVFALAINPCGWIQCTKIIHPTASFTVYSLYRHFSRHHPRCQRLFHLRLKTVLCRLQTDHSPLAIFQRSISALRLTRSLTSTLHSRHGMTGSYPSDLFVSGIMADNKNSATTTRPRLLSDILENPLSETAIPEEYTMHRSPISPAPPVSSRHYEQFLWESLFVLICNRV